ncbi:hypothetical protein DYB30_011106 [Aphanomyces astaci]|uniref:Pyrroline-5-carboxylate reductase catalytic N-terminal domain-containing protein n=2 Tax=Aphanomyces astaci TaxID=112090 RepID=A0A397DQR1_APHAT|nr:hypothetical protein DYB30_011106 [Aphanomyces astaci]RHY66383.1 hypothetical protein DYB38_008878 [Aphanomyces astaci]RHY74120.1 hypothetical protein DYB34_005102 [Aphanomyces astaci]RQM26317.1 hypothetical protein B5M09_003549 [Aphanomyces astaci]
MLAHRTLTSLRQSTLRTCGALRHRSHSAVLKEFAPMYTKATNGHHDADAIPYEPLNINRLAFIGGGNMAEAIISGIMVQELLPPNKIMVSSPTEESRDKFNKMLIPTAEKNKNALVGADVVVVAVKPQVIPQSVLRMTIVLGGTTAAAMFRAEKSGFRAVIADSVWAAYNRSKELGAQKRS